MASLLRLQHNSKIASTVGYFDKFDYPLTKSEIDYWNSPKANTYTSYQIKQGYYFLPGRERLIKLRREREMVAHKKWLLAKKVGSQLKHFPTIAAVFVTGALAMNNTPQADDIDLMVVTYPNCLWLTRALVNLYLHSVRRFPGQIIAPDKICINLWLDVNNLQITPHDLYRAHEIIQTQMLWDKSHIRSKFLQANSWVKNYLPNAYSIKQLLPSSPSGYWQLLRPLNWISFNLQYLYMLPKKTTEKVGLGYAYFHPRG